MAISSAIVAGVVSVASTGYGIYQQNQQAKKADALQQSLIASAPNPAVDQAKADAAMAAGKARQQKKTAAKQGYQSTILTSGQGTAGQPDTVQPANKTLLGL